MKLALTVLLIAAIMLVPLCLSGQVVAPAPGVKFPQAYLDRLAEEPQAFTLQRAWIEKARMAKSTRETVFAKTRRDRMSIESLPDDVRRAMAVSGTFFLPVLAGKFSNTGADPYLITSLQARLFDAPPDSSMRSLYDEMSYGYLNILGVVYGWYQVSNVDWYYDGYCNGLCPEAHPGKYILELLQLADPTVDFGTFDNDGPDGIPNSGDDDGFVDVVAIVHPEIGGECGNNNLWSHSAVVTLWPEFAGQPWTSNDARVGGGFIRILDYTMEPARGSTDGCGTGVVEIGVFAHELGHAFGLPDLYDTSYYTVGIGDWGLMGSGNWNTPPNPAHMTAWSKSQLGWIIPTEVGGGGALLDIYSSEITQEAFQLNVFEEKFARRNLDPISGAWSMRCMLTPEEATARGWWGLAGYGNGWDEAVERPFSYDGTDPVILDYDYAHHSEPNYDFTYVTIQVDSTITTLASYTGGPGSGHASIDLTPYLTESGATNYTLRFRFVSDGDFSDEDYGFDSSTNGAFKFDNVSVTGGGENYSTGFEVYEDGWHYNRQLNPPTEYFLVENRNNTGTRFDQHLHGQGLVIYHVEQDVATTSLGNSGGPSQVATRGMMLEEADNLNDLMNYVNYGDAGDVFPGSTNNTSFDYSTSPNSNSHNNHQNLAAANTISNPAPTMTAYLRSGNPPPIPSSIFPDTAGNDGSIEIADLLGSDFNHGAVFFLRDSWNNEYGFVGQSSWVGHAKLSGTLDLYAVPGGVYDVVVRNPDGQKGVIQDGFTVNDVLTGVEPSARISNALHQNYPNPFNPSTIIKYSIAERGHVTLRIYTVTGQLVRTLIDEEQVPQANGFSKVWNGLNDHDRPVASGVYFYQLTATNFSQTKKMVVLE